MIYHTKFRNYAKFHKKPLQTLIRNHWKLIQIWCLNLPIHRISGARQHLLLLGVNHVLKIAWQVWDPISFLAFAMDSLQTLQFITFQVNYKISK